MNQTEIQAIVKEVDDAIAIVEFWAKADDSVLPSYVASANGWRIFVMLSPPDICDGAATKGALVYHLTPSQRGVIRRAIEVQNGKSYS
jgi:hypothetical protein